MISMPAYDTIEGVTVFRDDEDPSRFYYLPRDPRIARGENGKPQFTFLRYQFPLERPETETEPGGGYLVFTTEMAEDDGRLNRIRTALQSRYRSEHPTEPNLPQVVLAPVDFASGAVRLIMMQDNRFVRAISLGNPSLLGNNTASVAVELPANGATLFYEALKGGGSIAAIEYDLTFPIRLPAVTILAHVDSKEVKEAVIGYTKEKVESSDTWGNDESHEVAHRTSIAETMESQGLIHLEILKGNVNLSQEDMESLRAFAFRAMDDFIKENFLKGGSIETAADRESQWMSYLQQDISKRFDLNVTYRDVISRPYNPSAQINPSFLGVPVTSVVQEIDLNNAPWFFNTLDVAVDTNMDFGKYGEIVHSVVGHLSYDQRAQDGTVVSKKESVIFTAADTASKQFKTRIAAVGKDLYHVEVEVNYKAGPRTQAVIKRFDTMTRHLTLDVPNPGVMEVNFATAPKAFDGQLSAVEVEVEYGDHENEVPTVVESLILSKEKPEESYQRVLYAAWAKPFRYRFTYVLEDKDTGSSQRSTTDWSEAGSGTRYVRVPTPFDQVFTLTILPAVDWEEVREVVVDLEYEDAEGDYHMATTKCFSKEAASSQKWTFPLRNQEVRSYRYAEKWLMANGGAIEKPWVTRATDAQTLVVGNAKGGVITITVDPGDIDLGGEVKRVQARLRYEDPANDVLDTQNLVFRDIEPQIWKITRADAKVDNYSFDVDYLMADGTRRRLANQAGTITATQDMLFLPTPPAS